MVKPSKIMLRRGMAAWTAAAVLLLGCGDDATEASLSKDVNNPVEGDYPADGQSGDSNERNDEDAGDEDDLNDGDGDGDPFLAQLVDVHVEMKLDRTVMTALDAEGASIATLTLLLDDNSVVWLMSDYPDGYARLAIDATSFGEVVDSETTLSEDVITTRAEAIVDLIESQTKPQEKGEWFWCATTAGIAVSACGAAAASGGLFLAGCAAGAAAATCKCITAWAARKGKRKCAED